MLSIPHIVVIFLVTLIVLGPEKLPQVARLVGKVMGDFRRITGDFRTQIEDGMREIDREARLKKELASQPLVNDQPQSASAVSPEAPDADQHSRAGASASPGVPSETGSHEPAKADGNRLEAIAKQLVAEGKAFEQQGELAEAKDKYVDAEGFVSTGEALSAINRINNEQKQQVEALLAEAHRLYDAGEFSGCVQQLQHGLEIEPLHAALHYDLALCHINLADRANAALHLDFAIRTLANEKGRTELLELRSTVVMGMAAPDAARVAEGEARDKLTNFNASYLQEDRDPGDTRAPGGSLFDQAKELRKAFPANAAVVFNSAKCAYEDARPEEAAQQLAEYLKLAPEALDRPNADRQLQNFLSLASLAGDAGQLVRQRYAAAARYLDYRRYDRAIAEYEEAQQALPDYPQTQWQLALLHEACGNVAKADEHFSRFQQLEPDPARKGEADAHLSTLHKRRAVYDANVDEAQDTLSALLLRSMGLDTAGAKRESKPAYGHSRWASGHYQGTRRTSGKLSESYVERELGRAREDLEAATELFPLGAEANELLALIYLEGNNWPEVYRSYDAVASQSFPVSFFAQANSAYDSEVIRAAKVEIGTDAIRLIYLSSYDQAKQISGPPAQPAGEDDLGNLVVSAAQPHDSHAEAFTIRAADLKGIETDENFVVLKLQSDQIYLAPLNMLSGTPFERGASRAFGSEYTRLFIRYYGYRNAKLGEEGMTASEKFKLGFEISRIGMAASAIGTGAPAAYGSAIRMARLVHALAVYRSVALGDRSVNAADDVTRLADGLQESAALMERTAVDLRRAIQGMEFKIIPAEPVPLKFRDTL